MNCTSCGAPLGSGDAFCAKCGTHVPVPEQPTEVLPVQEQPTAAVPPPGIPPPGQPQSYPTGGQGYPPQKSTSIWLPILIGFGAVMVLLLIVVGGFLIFRGAGNDTATPVTTSTPTPVTTPTPTPTPTPTATTPTESPTPVVTVTKKPRPTVTVTKNPPSGNSAPSGFKACGNGVYANDRASCDFAINVADAWYFNQSSYLYDVYSPVTGLYYDVYCEGQNPTWCTAGDNAQIWIG